MEDLVTDRYRIDEDKLALLAENDSYWESSKEFFEDVKDKEVSALSDRQTSWLEKIERGLSDA